MVSNDVGQGATPFTNRLAVLAGLASSRADVAFEDVDPRVSVSWDSIGRHIYPVRASRLWRGSYGKEYRGRMYTRGPDFDGLACLQPKAPCVLERAFDRARALHQGPKMRISQPFDLALPE